MLKVEDALIACKLVHKAKHRKNKQQKIAVCMDQLENV
jgi:hypothetical protein